MSFSEVLEVQKTILEKTDWDIKIKDPSILEKYENEFKFQLMDSSNFQKAISGLIQLLDDVQNLKGKYEYPTKCNSEILPNQFFEQIKLAIKNKKTIIKDALIPPPLIQEKRPEEEDIEWLLEQSRTQPDFWKLDCFSNTEVDLFQCHICKKTISEYPFYAAFREWPETTNGKEILLFEFKKELYCKMCGEKPNSPLLKLGFSSYLENLMEERILWHFSENRKSMGNVKYSVVSSDNLIPQALHEVFLKEINHMAEDSKYDFQPGSEKKIMNLIHPSLFSYEKITEEAKRLRLLILERLRETRHYDINKRSLVRTSGYHWLPTDVKVDEEGQCKFMSYVNNLFIDIYPNLYPILESILSCFIPLFEKCLKRNLKNTQLQVIVKAADYILKPGESYEGNWHLEGTQQEHIVASGIYYYEVTNAIVDEGLSFRRQGDRDTDWPGEYHSEYIDWIEKKLRDFFVKYNQMDTQLNKSIDEIRLTKSLIFFLLEDTIIRNAPETHIQTVPIGHVETKPGRCVVFPNEIQHKVTGIHALSTAKQEQKRRILCFFLIDPDQPIPSSLSVKPQQKIHTMNLYHDLLKGWEVNGTFLPSDVINQIINHFVTGLTLREALERRVRFMYDRRILSSRENNCFEEDFTLCEH
ncbi:hypothetical protein HMI54_015485 [Coelomomyces lativittatus]|nr:hypothetical protein HMI56_000214 [Coelomomyces lativittatus]KAJ1512827.1 hypothetical protein HMI54_015485 [Coelomomyces lativittatus]